jgi:benzil reductase ((S)-benzoin forming)
MEIYKDLYIITGASKGLGSQLAVEFANKNSTLLLIARDEVKLSNIAQLCTEKGASVHVISDDISNELFPKKLKSCLSQIIEKRFNKIFLINNASVIDPINKLFNIDWIDQKRVIDINLTSSIWLTSEFLRASQTIMPVETYVINISSGVSLKPISGWSLYCISKAGINMLTACIAEETTDWPNKVYTFAINPGALDTDMQNKIRASEISESPIAERFIKMHQEGKLNNPKNVAKRICNLIFEKSFVNGAFIDFNLV